MNTCQTCRFWRHIRDETFEGWPGPHGECQLIDEYSIDQLAWIAGDDDADLSLITKPKFGCVAWQGKEEIGG